MNANTVSTVKCSKSFLLYNLKCLWMNYIKSGFWKYLLKIFIHLYGFWSGVGPYICDWPGSISPPSSPANKCIVTGWIIIKIKSHIFRSLKFGVEKGGNTILFKQFELHIYIIAFNRNVRTAPRPPRKHWGSALDLSDSTTALVVALGWFPE
jgi:hypothetical protein